MSVKFGVYDWTYSGGSFIVALRPNGTFYCAKYSAQATWQMVNDKLYVDWKNYGQYDFTVTANGIDGSVRGDASKWRKMTFLRAFNETESAILGAGFGTVWNFEWEKGSFEIEFRCDGFNHFICKTYPAHSHWSLSDDQTISINWGQFGEYEMRVDVPTRTMNGFKKGQQANWRRATFLRALSSEDAAASVPSHDHAHVHSDSCSH